MRRFAVVLSVIFATLVGIVPLSAQPEAFAQEATPAGEEEMSVQGITFEPITIAPGVSAPDPTDMVVVRIALEPGALLPSSEDDPDGGLIIVESGVLTIRMETPLTVSRAGSVMGAIATAEATGTFAPEFEEIASGEEVTLGAGDAVYVPAHVARELRNDGQERAVALGILLAGAAMAEATPTS